MPQVAEPRESCLADWSSGEPKRSGRRGLTVNRRGRVSRPRVEVRVTLFLLTPGGGGHPLDLVHSQHCYCFWIILPHLPPRPAPPLVLDPALQPMGRRDLISPHQAADRPICPSCISEEGTRDQEDLGHSTLSVIFFIVNRSYRTEHWECGHLVYTRFV